MKRRNLLNCAAALALPIRSGAAPSAEEQTRIDRLIEMVSKTSNAQFIRNGKAHSAENAARFMREKLKMSADLVNNARDFIEHVATRSSTTGQLYMVRFEDGREMPCAEFLRGELARTRGD